MMAHWSQPVVAAWQRTAVLAAASGREQALLAEVMGHGLEFVVLEPLPQQLVAGKAFWALAWSFQKLLVTWRSERECLDVLDSFVLDQS
jgi:hypothetical protein